MKSKFSSIVSKAQFLKPFISLGIVFVFIILYIIFHFRAGFTFPIPWPDEAVFYYPANNFYLHNTLLSPEINPDRVLFWMPHGFMYVYGFLFSFFDNGLEAARTISMGFMILAFLMYNYLIRKCHQELIIIAGLVFISASCIIAGNVARMEALQLTVSLAGFVVLQTRRYVLSISILSLGLFIHPAGAIFLLGSLVYMVIHRHAMLIRKVDYFFLVLVFVVGSVYINFLYNNIGYLILDFQAQIDTRSSSSLLSKLLQIPISIYVLAGFSLLFVAVIAYRHRTQKPGILLILGITLVFIRLVGRSFWYNCYSSFGILLIFISIYTLLLKFLDSKISEPIYTRLISCVLLLIVLFGLGIIKIPYSNKVKWQGMYIGSSDYITTYQRDEIVKNLKAYISTEKKIKLYFVPEGDGVLFQNQLPANWKHFFPIFTESSPDYYIIHKSPYSGSTYTSRISKILLTKNIKLIFFDKNDEWYLAKKI